MNIFTYLLDSYPVILEHLGRHLAIVFIGIPAGILIGVPLGVVGAFHAGFGRFLTVVSGILMTIPSVALFGIAVILLSPIKLGIGAPPTVITLVVYSLLPIIRNTIVAIRSVGRDVVDAARGMGMTRLQILVKIRLPIALPIMMAGIRNAAVMGVGVVTIAYLVGAQSLGYLIFTGLGRSNFMMIVTGAAIVAFLGIGINSLLLFLEERLTSPGLIMARSQRDD